MVQGAKPKPDQPPDQSSKQHINAASNKIVCGLAAGVIQAAAFNPYDRALYLSVKNRGPFLRLENFRNPYQGFLQSIGGRALSGGIYFPLEAIAKDIIVGDTATVTRNFCAGTVAGLINAVILNPISAIKYKTWGRDVNRGLVREAVSMYGKGGLRPFLNGLFPTIIRDMVFGGIYTVLRYEAPGFLGISTDYQYIVNMTSAAIATIVSGPFNLARNIQYAVKSREKRPGIAHVLQTLASEAKETPTPFTAVKHLQQRLRFGWGTARVAVGMAFANMVYDRLVATTQEFDGAT